MTAEMRSGTVMAIRISSPTTVDDFKLVYLWMEKNYGPAQPVSISADRRGLLIELVPEAVAELTATP